MFDYILTWPILTTSVVIVLALCYLLFGLNRYISSVATYAAKCDNGNDEAIDHWPGVSVIVYAKDDASNLRTLLPQILEQEYSGQFEVIVVNDGHPAEAEQIIAQLEQVYSNLYMTFVPENSRSLSRRKLCITLGIKAARHDVILLTGGDCRVTSKHWIRLMAAPFANPATSVVLGHSFPVITDQTTKKIKRAPLNIFKIFDMEWTQTAHLSWAIAGHPYRGQGCNLAYRRAIFFENKGFSRSLGLVYGDDDIFINEISSSQNTKVQLSHDSMIAQVARDFNSAFTAQRLRYDFTAKYLPKTAKRMFNSSSWVVWLLTASTVVLSALNYMNQAWIIMALPIALYLLWWIVSAISWRRTARMLRLKMSRWIIVLLPILIMWHPFYNMYFKIRGRSSRAANLSWS